MSTPEAQALPPEVQQELRERWQALRLAGVLAIIVGVVLLMPRGILGVLQQKYNLPRTI